MNDFDDDYKIHNVRAHAGEELTKWEMDFLDSVEARLTIGQELSPKQKEVLDNIFRKYA